MFFNLWTPPESAAIMHLYIGREYEVRVSMKKMQIRFWLIISSALLWLLPTAASAQRDVHWQINPKGFPSDTSVFVDVEDNGVFKRDLTSQAFAVSVDEYAGDQGGWILNQQQVVAGQSGAQVLVLIDISSSYTGEFSKAKEIVKSIIGYMNPALDQLAVATAPVTDGFQDARLNIPFSADPAALTAALSGIKALPSDDKTGARICKSLSQSLRFFPDKPQDKYRAVFLITAGADKDEGNGDCVKDSYVNGLVPFFPIVFKLDKKYDDPRNSHKIDNSTHDLAENTGGRSIFRENDNANKQFAGLVWNRIRSQYYLREMFPCFTPMPAVEHISLLKVEGLDAKPIKFQATSAPPPTPTVTALYPTQADSKSVEDGKVDLTVDGTGFCGPPGAVKVLVNDVQTMVKSQNPFRVVATLNSANKTGTVKVINRFGESGESTVKFEIVKPPKGSQTASTLTYLVIGILVFAVLAILIVAMRSRKAKPDAVAKIAPAAPKQPAKPNAPTPQAAAAKTMAMSAIESAWVELSGGTRIDLVEGNNFIGRETTCKIQITAAGASREHCRIDYDKAHGLIWAEDLGSTNGSFYSKGAGSEKEAIKLEKKQLISSGDAVFVAGQKIVIRFQGGVAGEG
jgi:hypothetical protein